MAVADKMAKLTGVANLLNSISDSYAETVEAVEDQLAKIGVGIEVWLEAPSDLFNVEPLDWDPEVEDWTEAEACMLGYAKVEGAWHLAFRRVDYARHEADPISGESSALPLLKAPRQTRIEAAEKIEPLLDALILRAQNLATRYELARRTLAESLVAERASGELAPGLGHGFDAGKIAKNATPGQLLAGLGSEPSKIAQEGVPKVDPATLGSLVVPNVIKRKGGK